jgi:hypothetical protein
MKDERKMSNSKGEKDSFPKIISTNFSVMKNISGYRISTNFSVMVELDTSNGVMFPIYDPDTNLVYLCGKVC